MLDDIQRTLWATVDTLRAHMGAAEDKHLVLGRSSGPRCLPEARTAMAPDSV